jgi:hypothetical protein
MTTILAWLILSMVGLVCAIPVVYLFWPILLVIAIIIVVMWAAYMVLGI